MGLKHLRGATAAALTALALAACAPQTGGDVVAANQAQTAQQVSFGTVISSRAVTVAADPGGPGAVVGTLAGGIAGAALGHEVGGGTGQVLATGAGAVAGAAAGNQVARAAGTQESFEWTVSLDSGQTISVIQASPTFVDGQRVQVIQSGGTTRLAPA